MAFISNSPKWRIPVALGFNLFHGKSLYYGVGGIASVHRIINRNLFIGANLGITYAFNNRYDEVIDYKTVAYTYIDDNGQPQLGAREEPIIEKRNHYGSYIYFKPSVVIGFQF